MKLPRLFFWFAASVALMALVAATQPQQLPLTVYKFSLVAGGGVFGYWFDRALFPYARPDDMLPASHELAAAAMQRRALVVGFAMLAMGLAA